jgi:hypothetical protein
MYVDPKLYVPGDAAATVSSILEFEWLFRLGFVSNLAGQIVSLFLVHTLYKLFRSVDKGQARLMVMLLALSVPVTFLNMLNQYAAVLLISGAGHLSAFNPAQLQTLAMIFLNLYDRGTIIAEIFWGLWLVPLGLLAYKSGFIPKVLGVLLIVGCFGHLLYFLSVFLFPAHSAILTPIAYAAMSGELPVFLWFLIKGVKAQQPSSNGGRLKA